MTDIKHIPVMQFFSCDAKLVQAETVRARAGEFTCAEEMVFNVPSKISGSVRLLLSILAGIGTLGFVHLGFFIDRNIKPLSLQACNHGELLSNIIENLNGEARQDLKNHSVTIINNDDKAIGVKISKDNPDFTTELEKMLSSIDQELEDMNSSVKD